MSKELKNQIETWKSQYGKVYKTTIDGEDYIWRKLKRKEYSNIMNTITLQEGMEEDELIMLRQDEIVKTVTLYPDNILQEIEDSAGLGPTLSDEIIFKSGFGVPVTKEL